VSMDACVLALVLPLTAHAATLIPVRILPAAPPGVQLAASGRDMVSRACSTGALSPARDLLHHLRMGAAAEARGHNLAENLGFHAAAGQFPAVICPAAMHSLRPSTDGLAAVLGFPTAALLPTATRYIAMAQDAASSLVCGAESRSSAAPTLLAVARRLRRQRPPYFSWSPSPFGLTPAPPTAQARGKPAASYHCSGLVVYCSIRDDEGSKLDE
jgi:hypothetical protein